MCIFLQTSNSMHISAILIIKYSMTYMFILKWEKVYSYHYLHEMHFSVPYSSINITHGSLAVKMSYVLVVHDLDSKYKISLLCRYTFFDFFLYRGLTCLNRTHQSTNGSRKLHNYKSPSNPSNLRTAATPQKWEGAAGLRWECFTITRSISSHFICCLKPWSNQSQHKTNGHWCLSTVAWTGYYCMTSPLCWQIVIVCERVLKTKTLIKVYCF